MLGVIGGSGIYDLDKLTGVEHVSVETPYGAPSDDLLIGRLGATKMVFLPRHGRGHRIAPSEINYRANIWALKKLGVTQVISVSAVGSMKEEIEPGHLVIPEQFIDRTHGRTGTFFGDGVVAHVSLADPVCPVLSGALYDHAVALGINVHKGGAYVCINGPQFSTRAESHLYRSWGVAVIGMTNLPEARLAREAELCYATLALSTDYDCWRPTKRDRGQDELLQEILANLRRATDNAVKLIRETLKLIESPWPPCRCRDALKLAIWSDRKQIDPAVAKRLEPLVGRHLTDK